MTTLNEMQTVPGFSLQSKNFMVKFVAGLQNKQVSKSVEEETNWTDVMIIILKNIEKNSLSEEKLNHFITKDINSWIRTLEGAQNLVLQISVKIEERVYFPKPKCVTISFTGNLQTQIIFHVVRRNL